MVEKYVNREIPQIPRSVDILNIEEDLGEEIFARELVTRTFDRYASARTAVEARWTASDALFNGAVPARTWKGTTVP
ncbi:hypothetical protein, partial [Streptococcus pneumoniae]|uniref:hypothetical protein n=1 Tax=Streptococcus pneumoniae TaxID=1313 RepID=UPI001E3ABC44